jgi:hypothetical protein
MKAQENQKGLDLNGLNQIFIYVHDNLLREVISTIMKNTNILVQTRKKSDLEVDINRSNG